MGLIRIVLIVVRGGFRDRAELAAENLALRQQLAVLQQKSKRPRLRKRDRIFSRAGQERRGLGPHPRRPGLSQAGLRRVADTGPDPALLPVAPGLLCGRTALIPMPPGLATGPLDYSPGLRDLLPVLRDLSPDVLKSFPEAR